MLFGAQESEGERREKPHDLVGHLLRASLISLPRNWVSVKIPFFPGKFPICRSVLKLLGQFLDCLYGNSGCLGGLSKSGSLTPSVDKSSKGRQSNDQLVKRPSVSDDLWTTSTCDMDSSAAQSQGSISSISTSNQTVEPPEFVNHGLLLWNQTRQSWIGDKKNVKQGKQVREPKLSWNATYKSLLGSNKPFPQPIPLPEMVEFLVDVWEQEGLYE